MHQIEYFQCIKRGWSGSFRYERSSSHGVPSTQSPRRNHPLTSVFWRLFGLGAGCLVRLRLTLDNARRR